MQENPKKPKLNSNLIAIMFLASGIVLIIVSVFFNSQILSLIGVGLTFWGALFLLISPSKHVEASFLITSSLPEYMNIDRMLNYIKSKNDAYNIPPYPRDICLSEDQECLKEMIAFIPAENINGLAVIEDIAQGKLLFDNSKGLLITPPGISILAKIEQKHNTDFTRIPLSELDKTLPIFLSELNLAKEIEMTTNENEIVLKIIDSFYKKLYTKKYGLKSINLLGCPLVNAAACAIAKSTGKPTLIREIKKIPNDNAIVSVINIVQITRQPTEIEYREILPKEEPPALLVTKAEVFDKTVRFFVDKGLLKKNRVIVKEIPISQITNIEKFGNELNVTWKTVTTTFFTNNNPELFSNLRDEINKILQEQPKLTIDKWKNELRRNELLGVMNASIGILDFSFNILFALRKKRINWQRLKDYSYEDFRETFSFTGQLMPPLNLNFLNITSAIKRQVPEETSIEVYNVLRVINSYFGSLSLDDDLKKSVPNFLSAKAIILSYYALNDLLLGKVVGEKENKKEMQELESALEILAKNINFKVNVGELKESIDKIVPEDESEGLIEISRKIFKKEFLLFVFTS
jgi:hypothetical protein